MISVKDALKSCNKTELLAECIKILPKNIDVAKEVTTISNWLNYIITLDEKRDENYVVVINRNRGDFPDEKGYEYTSTSLICINELKSKNIEFPTIKEKDIVLMSEEECNNLFPLFSLPRSYAFEFNDWEEILGYSVSQSNIDNFGLETVMAGIIYEMTFFGYERENMEKEREKINKRAKEVDKILKLPEEEQKNHFVPVKEVLEMLIKNADNFEYTDKDIENERLYMIHSMLINNLRFAYVLLNLKKEVEEGVF